MFGLKRRATLCLCLGALLLLGGCDDGTSVPTPAPKPGSPQQEHFTDTVVLRNADTNHGESSRIYRRDMNGVLRQVVVNYQDRRQGVIYKDASGQVTGLKMTLLDGSVMEGKLATDGKTLSEGHLYAPNGKVKVDFTAQGSKGYQADGTTPAFSGSTSGAGSSWQLFQADGKTLSGEDSENGAGTRTALKLYDTSGALRYDETLTSSDTTSSYWASRTYVGVIYGAANKPVFRVTIQENSYDNGGGYVQQIEEFDSDGVTVKSTTQVNRWNAPVYKLGTYASQDELINARRAICQQVSDDKSLPATVVSQLTGLLIE